MNIEPSRIVAIRAAMKMNLTDFAAYCGVTRQTVANWEAGRFEPTGPARRMLLLMGEREGV